MSIRAPELQGEYTSQKEHIEAIISFVDTELERTQHELAHLIAQREHLFPSMQGSGDLVAGRPFVDQLYDEPSYNDRTIVTLLGLRGMNEFHHEKEKYDVKPSDSEELRGIKNAWRPAILHTAQTLGFTGKETGESMDARDRRFGIQANMFEAIPGHVQASVVPAARGISTPKRIVDALRNIEQGTVKTHHLIITGSDRPIEPDEKVKLDAVGLEAGETEFDTAILSVRALLGADIDQPIEEIDVPYGPEGLKAKVLRTKAVVSDEVIDISVVLSPVDPRRDMEDGSKPKRANSEETLLALKNLLPDETGKIVIHSHDAWVPYQNVVGLKTFGLEFGKEVVTTGPTNVERLYESPDGKLDILMAEGVQDEMSKYIQHLVDLRTRAVNRLELLSRPTHYAEVQMGFGKPVPSVEQALKDKEGYRTRIAIDSTYEAHREPLRKALDIDLAGQSYYSRPNAAMSEPLEGISDEVLLRESVMAKLHLLNQHLRDPSVTEFFGGEVELYIEDGLRSIENQRFIYEEAMPALIRKEHPHFTEEQVMKRRDELVAAPSTPESPSPHATGGAFDIRLRYKQRPRRSDGKRPFVEDTLVPMGFEDGETGPRTAPDYFETFEPQTSEDLLAQRNRRAFYRIMTGEAFGIETGFSVNPTEFWHWGIGDQLSAAVSGRTAYYGVPPEQ